MKSTVALALTLALGLAGCSLAEPDDEPDSGQAGGTVVLVTHESFQLPKKLMELFEAESGYDLQTRAVGDAGTLTTRLILTKDNPTGDVAFGVDNTFASRAVDEGVFAEHGATLPAGADDFALQGEAAEQLVPIDHGNVCVNIDEQWFER